MAPLGSLTAFMDALVALEQSISPSLPVVRWRPVMIDPPVLYNELLPSPADIPSTQIVRDTLNLAIRVAIRPGDVDEEAVQFEQLYDQVRDVLDADLVIPSTSVLHAACLQARRTSSRRTVDTFNDLPYLCAEFTLTAEFRRRFTP